MNDDIMAAEIAPQPIPVATRVRIRASTTTERDHADLVSKYGHVVAAEYGGLGDWSVHVDVNGRRAQINDCDLAVLDGIETPEEHDERATRGRARELRATADMVHRQHGATPEFRLLSAKYLAADQDHTEAVYRLLAVQEAARQGE